MAPTHHVNVVRDVMTALGYWGSRTRLASEVLLGDTATRFMTEGRTAPL
jgi:hypothetical protein